MNEDVIAANLAAVQRHFDHEQAGNWDKIGEMYTDDISWERLCVKQAVKGKAAVAVAYTELFATLTDVNFQRLDRFATEERVVDHSLFTFKVEQEGGLPLPVGTRGQMHLVHIFEMRDGRVAREIVMESPPEPR